MRRAVLCALVLTASLPAAAPPSAEAQVRAVLADQVAGWNAGDLDRFLATYWDDERLTFFSGGTVNKGLKAVRERYHRRYKAEGKEMGRLSFTDLEVFVLSPDQAIARGRYRLVMKKEEPTGLFTLWLRRLPGGWKIVHDHTSVDEKKP